MSDQLQLRHWQQIKQAQALEYAGTPEGSAALIESRRYGLAADRIDELIAECGHDQRNAAASQRESAMLLDKCEGLAAQVETLRDALVSLLVAAPVHVECNNMGHAKKYQHRYDEECPLVPMYTEAMLKAERVIALPNTAADILRQRDARTLREAAKKFSDGAEAHSAGAWVGRCIEQMADALENGK